MIWDDVGFLLRNRIAKTIMEHMVNYNKPLMPSEISKAVNMSIKNVSTRIGYLSERSLVKCLNPNEKKGRLYIVTKKGKEVLKKVKELEK